MDANYLKQSVGPLLADALASLYAYGIDTHNDPFHPHKDPISFIGKYFLEFDNAHKSASEYDVEHNKLKELQEKLNLQGMIYKMDQRQLVSDLQKALNEREIQKQLKFQREKEEERLRIEAEAAELAAAEQAALEASQAEAMEKDAPQVELADGTIVEGDESVKKLGDKQPTIEGKIAEEEEIVEAQEPQEPALA